MVAIIKVLLCGHKRKTMQANAIKLDNSLEKVMGIYFLKKKKSFKTHYHGKMTLYATMLKEIRLEHIYLKCFNRF